jgi:hypothetical protein
MIAFREFDSGKERTQIRSKSTIDKRWNPTGNKQGKSMRCAGIQPSR